MPRARKCKPVYDDAERQKLQRNLIGAAEVGLGHVQDRATGLKKAHDALVKELGPVQGLKRFIERVALAMSGSELELPPDSNDRKLKKALERAASAQLPGLSVSLVRGFVWERPCLRVELPLDVNLRQCLPAMQAYQQYFQAKERPPALPRYLTDEYATGRRLADLVNELNQAILAWAEGMPDPKFELLGLEAVLKRKGYTPAHYELYDEEDVRRVMRYYRTGE